MGRCFTPYLASLVSARASVCGARGHLVLVRWLAGSSATGHSTLKGRTPCRTRHVCCGRSNLRRCCADFIVSAVPWGSRVGAHWTLTNRPPLGDYPATIPGRRVFHIRLFSPAVEGVGDRSIAWRDF